MQLLLSFQLVFGRSVRGSEAEQSIAVHSPQCHSAQHVITIALSTCHLLLSLAGKGCQLVLEWCPWPFRCWCRNSRKARRGSGGCGCSDSCLWMNMHISTPAGLPHVWKCPCTSSWWLLTSCFRCLPVLPRAPFGRQAWLVSPHEAEKLQSSYWEEAVTKHWDTNLGVQASPYIDTFSSFTFSKCDAQLAILYYQYFEKSL